MRIGKINNNSFGSTLKINVPKESIIIDANGRIRPSLLMDVVAIAEENHLGVFVGKDVLIQDADEKVEEGLNRANIPYTVINELDFTV